MIYGPDTLPYDVAALRRIRLRPPISAGAAWTGIPHHELLHEIIAQAQARDWCGPTPAATYALGRYESDMAAAILLDRYSPPFSVFAPFIGIINWNSRRRNVEILLGVQITNDGEQYSTVLDTPLLQHKHTGGFAIPEKVTGAMDIAAGLLRRVPAYIIDRKGVDLDDTEADRLLMAAGRRGLVAPSRMLEVDAAFKQRGRSELGLMRTPSAWDLLAAFSLIAQKAPALYQMDYLREFGRMLPVAGKIPA